MVDNYDLELGRVVKEIKKNKARTVLLQLPDGLKPEATRIADLLKGGTGAEISIWLGSCFGACDVPDVDVDLVVQFGHASFSLEKKN